MNHNFLLKKFINQLIRKGKRQGSLIVLKKCFKYLKKISQSNPVFVFKKSINNVTPIIILQKIKRGIKITYSPKLATIKTRNSLGIRWIILGARKSRKGSLSFKLAFEFYNAFLLCGFSFNKKVEYHKRAESIRVFLLIFYANSTTYKAT